MKQAMNLKQTINIVPGKYVLAVSGGIDSVVLLDVLAGREGVELIVAHLDHGIREDSSADEKFVSDLAKKYGCDFESERVELGTDVSEAVARQARYDFLHSVLMKHGAAAIITAHHQDDLLETAAINLLRGTGRRGLSSLGSRDRVVRPLLGISKKQIVEYAKTNNLEWHEDSTNADTKYLRNKIRLDILPKGDEDWRSRMLQKLSKAEELNLKVDQEVDQLLSYRLARGRGALSRAWIVMLSHNVASEIVHAWLRRYRVTDINQKMVERIVVGIKAGQDGTKIDIDKQRYILITKRSARMMDRATNKTIKT